ncbi:MAG: acyloxyacyl hydrolase [Saprospiraceae bacterium]
MTLYKLCSYKLLIISIFFSCFLHPISAQDNWDWHDPVDVGAIDLGDNKVILYNGIAIGLIHLLTRKKIKIKDSARYTSLTGEWYHEYRKAPLSTVYSIKTRMGWKWKKGIWLGYEISAFVVDDDQAILGIGLSPFFSWNILNNAKWRLTYDNGVGPVYYFQSFPKGGTRLNFYTFYGLQLEIKRGKFSYALGVRNTHISNAFLAGKERNPSFDGVGAYFILRI